MEKNSVVEQFRKHLTELGERRVREHFENDRLEALAEIIYAYRDRFVLERVARPHSCVNWKVVCMYDLGRYDSFGHSSRLYFTGRVFYLAWNYDPANEHADAVPRVMRARKMNEAQVTQVLERIAGIAEAMRPAPFVFPEGVYVIRRSGKSERRRFDTEMDIFVAELPTTLYEAINSFILSNIRINGDPDTTGEVFHEGIWRTIDSILSEFELTDELRFGPVPLGHAAVVV